MGGWPLAQRLREGRGEGAGCPGEGVGPNQQGGAQPVARGACCPGRQVPSPRGVGQCALQGACLLLVWGPRWHCLMSPCTCFPAPAGWGSLSSLLGALWPRTLLLSFQNALLKLHFSYGTAVPPLKAFPGRKCGGTKTSPRSPVSGHFVATRLAREPLCVPCFLSCIFFGLK